MNLLTVQCALFGLAKDNLNVLLITPEDGRPRLPQVCLQPEETLEEAAHRSLEPFGLEHLYLEQLYSFGGAQNRVSIAYFALTKQSETAGSAGRWQPVTELPAMDPIDRSIIERAVERVRNKLRYEPIGFELLPKQFTLSKLQNLYETILERPLDKRNFRKKILSTGLLRDMQRLQSGVRHRAARLYGFEQKKYRDLKKRGYHFEL